MGTFTHALTLVGPTGSEVTVDAMVDTGAFFTSVPASILRGLGAQETEHQQIEFTDGRFVERPLGEAVGRIGDKQHTTICIFGDEDTESLLGAYTLEGFVLMVDPMNGELVPRVARVASPRLPRG